MNMTPDEARFREDDDTLKDRYLIFYLDDDAYGIEIRVVMEIIGLQKITFVPEMPEFIKGVINLRGKIIPVMDLRLKFKKQPLEYTDRTCVIIMEVRDIQIGLIVDSVSEVLTIVPEDIVPPPEMRESGNRYVFGIGKVGDDVKLLLDAEKLLESESELIDFLEGQDHEV